jgi:large subunit ribosomal protein L18
MNKTKAKLVKKERRKVKIRAKISGTREIPRLSVFRSNTSLFLQLIDDVKGVTIVSAHSREIKIKEDKSENDLAGKIAVAFELGKLIAMKALEKKVDKVVFDRGGNKYHGRVKAAAEGAREAGLIF